MPLVVSLGFLNTQLLEKKARRSVRIVGPTFLEPKSIPFQGMNYSIKSVLVEGGVDSVCARRMLTLLKTAVYWKTEQDIFVTAHSFTHSLSHSSGKCLH